MQRAVRLSILLILLAVAFSQFIVLTYAPEPLLYVDSNIRFGLPAYNTDIGFSEGFYCTGWEWNTANATGITFSGIVFKTISTTSLTASTQLSNITITSLDTTNWFNYTITGLPATQIFTIAQPSLVYIDGTPLSEGTKWWYSGGILTVSDADESVAAYYPYYEPTTTGEVDWYLRTDAHTVNGVTGYIIRTQQSNANSTVSFQSSGSHTVYWGYRVWIAHSNNATSELTGGSPEALAWRSLNGEGLLNSTWTISDYVLDIGWDAVLLRIYLRFGAGGSWQTVGTFISDTLLYKNIQGADWSFVTYTKRSETGGITYADTYWGQTTCQSGIGNVLFTNPTIYDSLLFELQNANFIGFITLSYTHLIGNLFYGLLVLIICVPLYLRYKSFAPILIIFILFGGAGGLLTILVPQAGFGIAWVFLLIGLAGLFYKVFR